jgi:hypothetical protein
VDLCVGSFGFWASSHHVAGQLLYRDNQWLLGRDRRQWECLLPPWDLPFGFSIDNIPFRPLEVEARINEIEIFLDSFALEELEDDQLFDFLPTLMGWILCPSSHGWPDYGWESPHLKSAKAQTCLLWQMLVHLRGFFIAIVSSFRVAKLQTLWRF